MWQVGELTCKMRRENFLKSWSKVFLILLRKCKDVHHELIKIATSQIYHKQKVDKNHLGVPHRPILERLFRIFIQTVFLILWQRPMQGLEKLIALALPALLVRAHNDFAAEIFKTRCRFTTLTGGGQGAGSSLHSY